MATVYTLTKPKEAWSLVSHFLGNDLLTIAMYSDQSKDWGMDEQFSSERRERVVYEHRTKLIGVFYLMVRRLKANGHEEEAAKIQQILDMVIDQDVTNPDVRKAIHDKHRELDPNAAEFEKVVAETNAQAEARCQAEAEST